MVKHDIYPERNHSSRRAVAVLTTAALALVAGATSKPTKFPPKQSFVQRASITFPGETKVMYGTTEQAELTCDYMFDAGKSTMKHVKSGLGSGLAPQFISPDNPVAIRLPKPTILNVIRMSMRIFNNSGDSVPVNERNLSVIAEGDTVTVTERSGYETLRTHALPEPHIEKRRIRDGTEYDGTIDTIAYGISNNAGKFTVAVACNALVTDEDAAAITAEIAPQTFVVSSGWYPPQYP